MDEKEEPKPSIIYVNPNKKYGLIFNNKSTAAVSKPKPVEQKPVAKPCIFGDDDDENLDDEDTKPKKSAQVNTSANLLKKQTQIEIERALREDPTAFEYDEVYDKLEEQKNKIDPKAGAAKDKSNEPKYIAGIMKAAARRQMEFEKLQDRKVQKEREAEGELWKDKEVFVTANYKKKLEERQQLEEEERRQEQIEALLDVRKQKDLSGFYYSMLKMRTGELVIEEESEKEKRLKEAEAIKFKDKSAAKQKSYRTTANDEAEEEKDAREEDATTNAQQEVVQNDTVEVKEEKVDQVETTRVKEETKTADIIIEEKKDILTAEEKKLSKEEQRKLRLEKLFKKRTVDDVFDRELAEYFVRKNQSLALKNFVERE